MICPFCQKTFAEEVAQKECRGCSLFGGCKKVKCPYCGYESPREPAFVAKFRSMQKKISGRRTDESR